MKLRFGKYYRFLYGGHNLAVLWCASWNTIEYSEYIAVQGSLYVAGAKRMRDPILLDLTGDADLGDTDFVEISKEQFEALKQVYESQT